MQKQQLNNALHIGGSLKTALNGQYSLSASGVIQEAMKLTQKHFWHFLPATIAFTLANLALFLLILAIQTGEPLVVLQSFVDTSKQNEQTDSAIRIAMFFATILSAPLYAGASLMGLSHAIGFRTKPWHIVKGLTYGLTVTVAVCLISLLENISNQFIPLLGLFIGITLSMTILLICEKRLSLLKAMQISFRATVKKILPFIGVYFVLAGMFLFSYATAGIALIWVLPFMFNVKGVLYREMFGVGIEIIITDENGNNDEIFHA